jgi:PAS domain S-box-containing protein
MSEHVAAVGQLADAAAVDAALLALLLTNAPVGVAFFDRDLRFRRVNEALAEINGVPARAHLGRTIPEVLPNQNPEVIEALNRVLETGEPLVNVEVAGETPRAPGVTRYWLTSYYPVRMAANNAGNGQNEGVLLGLGAIVSEITERKRAEEAQRASEAALQASQAQTRTFLRDILSSVTEGRLRLCDREQDLPAALPAFGEPILLASQTLREVRHRTVDAAVARDLPPERWQDLVTAVGEAAMNAVVHGGGGEARVCASNGAVQVWIVDRGAGIAMDRLHRATLERGYTTAGTMGHGFWMMLKTCDRVWLLTGASGTTMVLEQDRIPPEPAWLRERHSR